MVRHNESIRVFNNPLLEAATHVHPAVPLILWTPIIAYLIYRSLAIDHLSPAALPVTAAAGLLVWSVSEYALHRWVFHFKARSTIGRRFVYLFHGLHHDDPHDSTRLVMPPVPALLIVSLLYPLFSLLCPMPYFHAFMGFFLIGYLCYDYIHYATHHFRMSSRLGKALKRNHMNHHFRSHDTRYGVSSPLWDVVFRTMEPR